VVIYASLEGNASGKRKYRKKTKKVLKILLTNGKYCGMIAKLSPSGGSEERTLKTEQQLSTK